MTKMLINIFVTDFYKKYAKLFFFSFCLFVSYFLFIQIAGVFLDHSRDFWTLFLSLQFATEPIFILIFWILAFLYILLSIRYLMTELVSRKLEFLRYTFFTKNIQRRYTAWLIVIALINFPILFYSLYSFTIAFVILGKFSGLWTILFVIFLCLLSVVSIDFSSRRPISERPISNIVLSLNIQRYFFAINLINLFKNKFHLIVAVKTLCFLAIFITSNYMEYESDEINFKILLFLSLTISSFTTVILYNDFLFEGSKLIFSLNFPLSRIERFLKCIPFFLVLMIPEEIFSITQFGLLRSIIITLTLLVFLLMIRSGILAIGNRPMLILKTLTVFYFISLLLLLYNLLYTVLVLSFLIALILFIRNYKFEKLIGKNEN